MISRFVLFAIAAVSVAACGTPQEGGAAPTGGHMQPNHGMATDD